ncbi:MAG: hypothetical protein ABSB60_17305 [Terracidiphilus sp.]|jgi:hypothetical protein
MEDAMNWDAEDGKEQLPPMNCDSVGWISTEQLEDELFNSIMADSSPGCDDQSEGFEEIDDSFDGDDEYEDEAEQRRSTLRLLATLRPQLAELLGGPPAESYNW